MPAVPGFSPANPLLSYHDFRIALQSLLKPIVPYISVAGARARLPIATVAIFDDSAAELEGYARPLWGIASLLMSESEDSSTQQLAEPYLRGIVSGTDPESPEYWGEIGDFDQRMVEAEIIAFALLSCPKEFYGGRTDDEKTNIKNWLLGLNGRQMPPNNWRWFRIMTNLALVKTCGLPYDGVGGLRLAMDEDFEVLDALIMEDGWSSDGLWCLPGEEEGKPSHWTEEFIGAGRQADYYSGSFAIQFSQLMYIRFAGDSLDSDRCSSYRQGAGQFAASFWQYFDEDGAAIPFGRSLTYRFAAAAFFSALVLADPSLELITSLPFPLSSPGVVKGFLLRHLRWWTSQNAMFYPDGTLSIGYTYPNLHMCEAYNSPQSVYWCLKSFVALSHKPGTPFWTCEELPYPRINSHAEGLHLCLPARQIVCNVPHGNHHFLLSSGQFCSWPLKAAKEKYGKFAYSSAFGFGVPTGPRLAQMAPDSMLLLSRDHGVTWESRWKTLGDTTIGVAEVMMNGKIAERLPTLTSKWKPWTDEEIEVVTTLVPPTTRWPNLHVRLHRLRIDVASLHGDQESTLRIVEGGFALPQSDVSVTKTPTGRTESNEKRVVSEISALVESQVSVSGLYDLSLTHQSGMYVLPWRKAGGITTADPNSNLLHPRTLVPVMHHELRNSDLTRWQIETGQICQVTLVTGVIASSKKTSGPFLRSPANTTHSAMPSPQDSSSILPKVWYESWDPPKQDRPMLVVSLKL